MGEEKAGNGKPRPRPEFFGEIVERRHPALVAVVFLFGLLFAAAPFLFRFERSPYREALELYDVLCRARDAGDVESFRMGLDPSHAALGQEAAAFLMSRLKCVDRLDSDVSMVPVRGSGAGRAYDLTLVPRSGSMAGKRIVMRFEMSGDVLRWDPGYGEALRNLLDKGPDRAPAKR